MADIEVNIKRVAARKASWLLSKLRLDRAIDQFNRPAGGCILCYHHISAPALEAQLALLSERYVIISLDEFVSRLETESVTAGLMAVTFDDGFAHEVEDGASLAIKHGWPMTFYLPTEFISSGRPHWFEEIGPWLRAAPGGDYQLGELQFHLGDKHSRSRARDLLVRHLFHRQAVEISRVAEKLGEALFGGPGPPEDLQIPGPISWQRIKELSRHDGIAFEAHSVTHPFLATLTRQQILREMEDSKGKIEQATGRPVRHFCYPYGDWTSIGPRAPEVARQIFRSAVTILHGRCHRGVDPVMLPRVALFEHDTEAMAGFRVGSAR